MQCTSPPRLTHLLDSYGTAEVAEHAVALALSLKRGMILQHDFQRAADSA